MFRFLKDAPDLLAWWGHAFPQSLETVGGWQPPNPYPIILFKYDF
jgi:hypothetical protein